MEYVKYHGRRHSEMYGEEVSVLEYQDTQNKYSKKYYCQDCSMCGRPILRKMFVIQSAETGVEIAYLGADCYKKLR